jgi:hypothetical protein
MVNSLKIDEKAATNSPTPGHKPHRVKTRRLEKSENLRARLRWIHPTPNIPPRSLAMLSILDRAPDRTCQGKTRREFLKIGSLGWLGGLTLPALLECRAQASRINRLVADKSVVLLFLQGGPSHIELFDPKMTAPAEIRSTTGEVQTSLPGITFGGTFPKMAQMADKLAVVRSYASRNADHSYLSVTSGGGNPLKAAMGALYARVAGPIHPRTGMPTNMLVLPEAVQSGLKMGSNFETGALPTLTSPGDLGPSYGAFDPSGGSDLKRSMQLSLTAEQFENRRQLLYNLDELRRRLDGSGAIEGLDRFQQQAFDVISRGIVSAFDLSKEDPRTVERYDTSKLFRMEDATKWYDMKRSSNLLGKQMLLARRLCEAGCGFVTVSDCGWDMHSNSNSPKNLGGMKLLGPQVDHAVSAFIEDVNERGLGDKILLVVTGEMGRSPRINRDGGRDHYGNMTSLVFAGGGLKMGQVIGQSDKNASAPASEPYTPKHLLATIMHLMMDLTELRAQPNLARVADVVTGGEPIAGLL